MRVLVCGSRDFTNRAFLFKALDGLHGEYGFSVVIHGAYRGADQLAKDWAESRGIPDDPYPADWKRLGSPAGPIRNQRMIDEGKPELVIAFPGQKGTRDMKRRANKAGLKVIEPKDS